jgi:hypothetical protein
MRQMPFMALKSAYPIHNNTTPTNEDVPGLASSHPSFALSPGRGASHQCTTWSTWSTSFSLVIDTLPYFIFQLVTLQKIS